MQLQENSKTKTHDIVWEFLICINIIKEHYKKAKTNYIQNQHLGFLVTAINTTLTLTQKYFKLISKTFVYPAAFLLNPT